MNAQSLHWNPVPPAWMTDQIAEALTFASHAHNSVNHVRKYTGEPYIYHPLEVANILHNRFPEMVTEAPEVLMAALLHDTVEDTKVTFTELQRTFGDVVMELVMHLTDLVTKEQANRATRKQLECSRLRVAPAPAQIIKLADFMSNTTSIVEHDKDFSRVYLREIAWSLEAIATQWQKFPERVPSRDNAFSFFNEVALQVKEASEKLGIVVFKD